MLHGVIRCLALSLLSIIGACSPQVLVKPTYVNKSSLIPRVVNGYDASLGDVPYQISFKRLMDMQTKSCWSFCGGVIIGPSKLVSAAHCFRTSQFSCCSDSVIQTQGHISQFFAVAGTLLNKDVYKPKDNPSGAQWRRLKMVISPSTYKFPRDDIAIVITTEPFYFNAHIKPIPYARRYIDYKGECLVSGYGKIHSMKPISSEKLLLARLELLPTYWCNNLHGRNMRRFICTNTKVSDVAQGDSGGPLVCRSTGEKHEDSTFGILVGIVSGTRLLGYKGKSSFFTRVSYFSKYITRENGAEGSTFVYVYHYVIVLNTFYAVF